MSLYIYILWYFRCEQRTSIVWKYYSFYWSFYYEFMYIYHIISSVWTADINCVKMIFSDHFIMSLYIYILYNIFSVNGWYRSCKNGILYFQCKRRISIVLKSYPTVGNYTLYLTYMPYEYIRYNQWCNLLAVGGVDYAIYQRSTKRAELSDLPIILLWTYILYNILYNIWLISIVLKLCPTVGNYTLYLHARYDHFIMELCIL